MFKLKKFLIIFLYIILSLVICFLTLLNPISSPFLSMLLFVIYIILPFCVMAYCIKKIQQRNIDYGVMPYKIDDAFKLYEKIPNFNEEIFKNKAFEIYKDVQEAKMNNDIDTIKKYTTEDTYNKYLTEISKLKLKKNIKDFELSNFEIRYIEVKENVRLVVSMEVKFSDYTLNNKIVNVFSDKKSICMYRLAFIIEDDTIKFDELINEPVLSGVGGKRV